MFNSHAINGDEERLRNLLQKLNRNQTDIVRLWGRVGQYIDHVGDNLNGQETPGIAYTPAMGPTSTAAPTTSTTTTPAPEVDYLYPIWDRLITGVNFSTGSTAWSLLDDRGGDWPTNTDYISIDEATVAALNFWIEGPSLFHYLSSVEIQMYVMNENGGAPITFDALILGDDELTPLTNIQAITVGTGESSFSLRTATFTLEPEAQNWGYWSRPRLNLSIETDADAGSPELQISCIRIKPTYIPLF